MTWSYDSTLTVDADRVRLLIGDNDVADQQLADEEIAYLLTANTGVYGAAAAACEMLAAKYARYSDKWVGDLKILASQKAKAYLEMVKLYRAKGGVYGIPTAGGIYVAEKEANEENEALVQPTFSRDMHDNIGD